MKPETACQQLARAIAHDDREDEIYKLCSAWNVFPREISNQHGLWLDTLETIEDLAAEALKRDGV